MTSVQMSDSRTEGAVSGWEGMEYVEDVPCIKGVEV